jgi:hypothetical protein
MNASFGLSYSRKEIKLKILFGPKTEDVRRGCGNLNNGKNSYFEMIAK